jgi:hypothetical protein
MTRDWMPAVLLSATLLAPATARPATEAYDEIRAEVAALATRVGRLEAENQALKRRNDELENRMAELRGPDGDPGPAAVPAVVAVPPVAAEPPPEPWYERVKVGGYVFGDAYAVLANHDATLEDRTGFWIRRGYLTFDSRLADGWSARLRFEVNSAGDFDTSETLEPYVKDAYLAWKRDGRELLLGLSSTPTFEFIEGQWGHRPIEKTPLDLYRLGNSRDLGVAYKGESFDGRVFYHAMLGNGSGTGGETNKGKKVMAGLGFRPTESLSAQLYADYEDRPGATDRSTLQAFLGWTGARSRYGLQYAVQDREVEGAEGDERAVASAYGVWQLVERGTLVVRYDRSFDGYPDASRIAYLRIPDDTRFDLAILAWEHRLKKNISLIPNFEYVRYRDSHGEKAPGDDLYGRLTLYYEF